MNAQRWQQVRAEFDALVELAAPERTLRLAAIGATDPARRRSLETLLAADAAAEERLSRIESPLLRWASSSAAPDADPPAPADERTRDPFGLAGQVVSHFQVRELLDTGGMGVVYQGEDLRLNRAVALKFLLPQLQLDDTAKARFLEEARAVAALDHPNLCTVHEVGESEDGRLFLAMPLYAGETLKARLARSGVLAVEEALGIARQVAQGLSCAHAAGVMHRDLKPANLLLTAAGGVKILDFGLVRVRDRSVTAPGLVLGTVAYMAPEQLRHGTVDARADLWALGVVLYEMLTGRRPFESEHDLALARAIVHEEPTRPSVRRSDLPPAVEEIVATLLQKEPARRYPSAEVLLQELEALPPLEERPPSRPRASWPGPGAGWAGAGAGARRRLALPLAVGVVALLGLGGRALWQRGGADALAEPFPVREATTGAAAGSIAVLPFTDLSESRENEYFSNGISEEILTTLANVGGLRVIGRTSVMQYKDSTKPARQIADELRVAHLLAGSVQRAGDRVRIRVQLIDPHTDATLWAERYDRPLEDIFAVQSEIAQEIAQALRVSLSAGERARLERRPTSNLAAHDYVLRARSLLQIPSPQMYEPALELIREAIALDPSYADAFAARAFALRTSYWFRGEATWLDSAVVAARHAIHLDPEFAVGYAELGVALGNRGDREAALGAHRRAVALNPNLSDGLAVLSEYDFGRLDEAARLWGRALETDPTNAITLWMAGRTYLHLGMPERARALFLRARQVQPGFHWMGYYASLAFLVEGRPQEARAEIERTLAATREDPDALLWAGHVMAWLGELPAARSYYERGLPAATSLWEKEQAGLTLAWILQQSGEMEQAERVLQEASERFQRRRRGQPTRPEDYIDLASMRVVRGDREGALHLFEQGVRNGWRIHNEVRNAAILGSLHGDPRFERLMAEVRADVDRQRARVEREGW